MPFTRPARLLPIVILLVQAAAAHAGAPLRAAPSASLPPALHARSAILIEARTGTVLFEDQADERIAPASLTKLMTLHLALQWIAEGRLDPSEMVVPGPEAWAKNMPPRSSVMFLGPGQRLTVETLLQGLVVDSGNDAAVAIADRIAGSVPGFAHMMNQEALRLGYRVMHFVEPAGISAENTITAREYADFCRYFIEMHPEALKTLFSLKDLTYPLPDNLTGGNTEKPITQSNRNVLLGRYEGADGLKTGYLDESGYNIAVTAERQGLRLISVILGVPDLGRLSGAELRATESAALLDYGFANFITVRPGYEAPAPVRVWKGNARSVALAAHPDPIVALRRENAGGVKAVVEQATDIEAPVRAGQALGSIVVTLEGRELARFPLVAETGVDRGGFLRRAVDSIIMFFGGVSRRIASFHSSP